MSLHNDLLEQARHLATRERSRPKQASLRRAVSAAYYAVFHLMAREGARRLAPGEPRGLREQVQRAFNHTAMNEVCRRFAQGNVAGLPPAMRALVVAPLAPRLVFIAAAFVDLQAARHRADYDTTAQFSRSEANDWVDLAAQVFSDWPHIRDDPNTTAFLAALLLHKNWRT